MRALLFVVIIVVIAVIAAVTTGYVSITNVRGQPPELTATRNSVSVKGGQPAAFDVEAGSVKIGSKPTTVNMPTLEVRKPGTQRAPAATNTMK